MQNIPPPLMRPNRLLAAMPSEAGRRLAAHGELVELHFAKVLTSPGEHIGHVYFPTTSVIAMACHIDVHSMLGLGLVGNEGMLGLPLILGVRDAAMQIVVQGAGEALRIEAELFRRELALSAGLRHTLAGYLHVVMCHLVQTAACNRFHLVVARLARWLLMTQDRAQSHEFHITHAFLGNMLGVRRVGITKAATYLHNRQLIRYSRGDITVLDRAGLEAISCGCYASDKALYASMIGE